MNADKTPMRSEVARVPADVSERITALQKRLAKSSKFLDVSRSDTVRACILAGLEALEKGGVT